MDRDVQLVGTMHHAPCMFLRLYLVATVQHVPLMTWQEPEDEPSAPPKKTEEPMKQEAPKKISIPVNSKSAGIMQMCAAVGYRALLHG